VLPLAIRKATSLTGESDIARQSSLDAPLFPSALKKDFAQLPEIGQFEHVLSLMIRFVIVVLAILAAYCFWPRTGSLTAFHPEEMARLQVESQRFAIEGKKLPLAFSLYEILNGQYKLPPLKALMATWHYQQAFRRFHRGADLADQERAAQPLADAFAILCIETHSEFDVEVAARLEIFSWMLAGDRSKQSQLASAISEKIALFYGASANEFTAAANLFAKARRLASEKRWAESQNVEAEAWTRLKQILTTLENKQDSNPAAKSR
jgi:hypothetical protein